MSRKEAGERHLSEEHHAPEFRCYWGAGSSKLFVRRWGNGARYLQYPSPDSKVRWSILKDLSFSFVLESATGEGMIETVILDFSARRKVICVAKRVQSPLSRGKGRSVRPSKTEDLPLDWSPTTTSFHKTSVSRHPRSHWLSYSPEVKECIY